MKASPWAARHAGVVEALFACLARARTPAVNAHGSGAGALSSARWGKACVLRLCTSNHRLVTSV
ncbi:hypothetical protein PF005_g22092 [Phytophthora fragariae]|uniref:Uncharacterized protein n=1 Tax=Phytophthora fragariae TaxID=53985 RepID=A0A6A3WJA6_9STRA|nr:hypothetical protein PF003_g39972 [Phytophthora fragariae]KAE9064979.1 hypothetical protein PF010_g28402 [Phytophthora fragariae]KAE9106659.1 hypothetical protein PF006_g21316 [Phytophthora fragariae]KAE9183443.1 hypothetical protein PF005_g22092 [Phytophthora fragariae]KAE9286154.1 hypothetical protein PF001_g21573 [Phytophthora fragariae]